MAIKLSHSSMSKFTTCAKSWQLHYQKRIRSKFKGSALYFGSAMDEALNHLLLNKDEKNVVQSAIQVFDAHWEQQKDNENNVVDLPMNPYIKYSKYDYDADLMEKSDWAEMFKLNKNAFDIRSRVTTTLETKRFSEIDENDRVVYNFMSWLSLRRKAHLLIQAYYDQLVPHIKEVLTVQKEIALDDGAGSTITGFVDMVVILQDGRCVIMDNKTSSVEYGDESVVTSPQLSLYKSVLNIFAEDETNEWKQKIDACGFMVLSKKIQKDTKKVCKACGYKAEEGARHKTCNQMIENELNPGEVRCGGEWDVTKKFSVDTQMIIDDIPEHVENMVIENADAIRISIETNVFPRNFNACEGKFGKCDYYDLCWKLDKSEMIQLPERKKDEKTKTT